MGLYGLTVNLLVFLIAFGQVCCNEPTKVVETKQGKVEGNLAPTGLYYEFCGIRYATVKNRYMVCYFIIIFYENTGSTVNITH